MPLRGFIVAFLLSFVGGQAIAADPIGYSEALDALYSIDLVTHEAAEIGHATPAGIPRIYTFIDGLTPSPSGVLYAVSDAGAVKTLLTIDRYTGLANPVGALDLGTNGELDLGLAFTCDGALWMSAGTGQFWQVDPSTAAVTTLGNLGITVTGLAARGNLLYAAGGQGDNTLYEIDTAHVVARPVGSYGSSTFITVTSPGFDAAGQLWAVLDYVPPLSGPQADWNDIARLSLGTGALTNLGNITPAQPKWSDDLKGVGLKGLAIPSGVCSAPAPVASAPALSWHGVGGLFVSLALFGGSRAQRRHPSARRSSNVSASSCEAAA